MIFSEEFKLLYPMKNQPSMSYLFHTCRLHCTNIKVRQHSCLKKYYICKRFRLTVADAVVPRSYNSTRGRKITSHLQMIWRERIEYEKRIYSAILRPWEYPSMIADRADPSAYGIPHIASKIKTEHGNVVQVIRFGVLKMLFLTD